ncbi:PilZ domain-containing protein, partial [bacterium]|nr:PilZ domain-containing protein [bacterium]
PPTPDDPTAPTDDGKWTQIQRKIDESDLDNIDKRQHMRFGVNSSEFPVALEQTGNGVTKILDVSKGGVALEHDGSLKVGDEIMLHMIYGDMDIYAEVKIVTATTSRAGAEFINLDKATANQILYLNIISENWHNKLSLR